MLRTLLTAIFFTLFSQTAWAVSEEKFSEALAVAKLDAVVVAIRDNCVREIGGPKTTRECQCAINNAQAEKKLSFEIRYERCVTGMISSVEMKLISETATQAPKPKPRKEVAAVRAAKAICEDARAKSQAKTIVKRAESEPQSNSLTPASTPKNRMTQAEINSIQNHIHSCWNPPMSIREEGHIVNVEISFDSNGCVLNTRVQNKQLMRVDRSFRQAVIEVLGAVSNCSPLPVPREKYPQWQSFVFSFDPKFLTNQ